MTDLSERQAGASGGTDGWTRLVSWDSFRYDGSGWWLDLAMPHEPLPFLVFAFAAPIAVFLLGLELTADRGAFLATHDVNGQLAFMTIHILCLRVAGSLWTRGLGPALRGIGIGDDDERLVRRGLFGTWANLGAVACCAYFIVRDSWLGWVPGDNGLTAFNDPDQWDFGALGGADVMKPPVSIGAMQDLRAAAEIMVAHDLRSIPVVDAAGTIVGMLDEHEVSAVLVQATRDPGAAA